MRQYEFKTINPGQANKSPMNITNQTIPFVQSPKVNFQQRTDQSFSNMPTPVIKNIPKAEEIIKSNPPNISSGGSQHDQNLSLMRKQLELLMKQTQHVGTKTNPSIPSKNQQSSLSNVRSLETIPLYEKTDFLQKDQSSRNYQKYSNNFQQTQTAVLKSTTPKISSNSSFDDRTAFLRGAAPDITKTQMRNSLQNLYSPIETKKQYAKKSEPINNEQFGKANYSSDYTKDIQVKQSNSFSSKLWDQDKNMSFKSPTSRVDNPEKFSSETSLNLGYSTSNKFTSSAHAQSQAKQQNKGSYDSGYDQFNKNYDIPKQKKQLKQSKVAQPSYNVDSSSYSSSFNNNKQKDVDIELIKYDNKYLKSENYSQAKRLAQAEQRIRKLETQASDLRQTQKSALGKEDYYKNLLTIERQNTKQLKQDHSLMMKQSAEQFKAQFQAQKQSMTVKINSLAQKHQQELKSIHEKYQSQIKQLQAELNKKQQNIVSLVKQIKVYDDSNGAAAGAQQIQQQQGEQQGLVQEVKQKAFEIQNLRKELDSRNEHIQVLNKSLIEFKQEINDLRKFKTSIQTQQYAGFDEILLTQMKTIGDYKQKIQSLNEKTNDLKLNLIEAQRKNENYENEIRIIELKHRSELNSLNTQAEIEMTNRDNIIGTLNKKMQTLEQRLKSATNQIKVKDGFVKQHLVGRADTADARQYIENVLAKYETTFSQTRQQQLRQELEKAKKQLELYQKYA